jgi:hypothetical protein
MMGDGDYETMIGACIIKLWASSTALFLVNKAQLET